MIRLTVFIFISGEPCWHSDFRCRRTLFCCEAVRPCCDRQGDIQWWYVYLKILERSSISPLHQGLRITLYVCPAGGCILSVAVVKNSSLDIRSLQGLRSCHSGVRWTAGWSLPLGFLLSRNHLSWSKEQPLSHGNEIIIIRTVWKSFYSVFFHFWSSNFQSTPLFFSSWADVSTFFSASCIPGAAALAPPLCALCQGQKSYIRQKNYHCETSHSEPFYNSQGALRSASTKDLKAYFKHVNSQQTWISSIASFVLSQMSQEWSRRCCICGPFSSWKY